MLKSCKHGVDTSMTSRTSTSFLYFCIPRAYLPLLAPAPPRTIPASYGGYIRDYHIRIPWDGGDTHQNFHKLLAPCSPQKGMWHASWSSDLASFSARIPEPRESGGVSRCCELLWTAKGLVTSVSLCSVSLLQWPHTAGASQDKKVRPKPKDRQVYLQALAWDLIHPLRRCGQAQRVQEASTRPLELGTGIPTKAPATDDPVWVPNEKWLGY